MAVDPKKCEERAIKKRGREGKKKDITAQ